MAVRFDDDCDSVGRAVYRSVPASLIVPLTPAHAAAAALVAQNTQHSQNGSVYANGGTAATANGSAYQYAADEDLSSSDYRTPNLAPQSTVR